MYLGYLGYSGYEGLINLIILNSPNNSNEPNNHYHNNSIGVIMYAYYKSSNKSDCLHTKAVNQTVTTW